MEMTAIETASELPMDFGMAEGRVRTLIPPIDAFLGGLRPGELSLIDSSDRLVFHLVNMINVSAVREGLRVAWVDGGNSANPYELTGICKRLRVRPEHALEEIVVARAFTAYQMSALVEDMLPQQLEEPGVVVVSCFADLYQDVDMAWSEAEQLMKRGFAKLRELAAQGHVVLVTNYGPEKLLARKGLRDMAYGAADTLLKIEARGPTARLLLPREGRGMQYRPVAPAQTTLDEFGRY
ncbi:MAG: hypothetical protein WCK39_06665 [Methanomassiliicoccales archaeon]